MREAKNLFESKREIYQFRKEKTPLKSIFVY